MIVPDLTSGGKDRGQERCSVVGRRAGTRTEREMDRSVVTSPDKDSTYDLYLSTSVRGWYVDKRIGQHRVF